MEEETKAVMEKNLTDLVRRHKFRFVVKIGDRRYFRHKDGWSAILRRDDNGEVKLERLDK